MSQSKAQTQSAAPAGSSGEAAGVGSAVGGVRSGDGHHWLDLWAMNPETRACLGTARRDDRIEPAATRVERRLPSPAWQSSDGKAQLAGGRPRATVAVAQTQLPAWSMESLPGPTVAWSVWPVAAADAGGEKTVMGRKPNAL